MNEESARAVTLLQAFETAQPPSPNWGDDDRAWATRLALQDDAAGTSTAADSFIARRAHHAVQRLAPREPGAARWLARRLWHPRWIAWAALAGGLVGLLADSIGSSQRINLLAPPLWGVLAWNAVVYVVLIGHGFARLLTRPTRPGALVRLTQRVLQFGRRLPGRGAVDTSTSASVSSSASALRAFATLWLRASASLSAARASTLLHAAAAALALGLIAGLYLRGLVFDYRAAWESTFLSADAARAILSTVLAPAAAISGIALPDAAGFEALRVAHGGAAAATTAGASAASWIHLLALTLGLFVVLPRSVLALVGAARARWLARRFALPMNEPYFQRLARLQHGDVPRVVVQPYAMTPTAQAAHGFQAFLLAALGDGLKLRIAPTAAFGAEDETGAALEPATTLAIALFDLCATPEAETHGRFAQQLAAHAPAGAATIVLVDEAVFKRRFGGDSPRLVERREAWRLFGESLGTAAVCVDLEAPGAAAAAPAIQSALRAPVARVVR